MDQVFHFLHVHVDNQSKGGQRRSLRLRLGSTIQCNTINWLVCTVHLTTPILSCDHTHTVMWPNPYCHMTKPKSYNVFVYIVFQEVSNCLQVSVCDSCVQRSVPPRRRMRCKYDMVARALILSHACTQVACVSCLYKRLWSDVKEFLGIWNEADEKLTHCPLYGIPDLQSLRGSA